MLVSAIMQAFVIFKRGVGSIWTRHQSGRETKPSILKRARGSWSGCIVQQVLAANVSGRRNDRPFQYVLEQ